MWITGLQIPFYPLLNTIIYFESLYISIDRDKTKSNSNCTVSSIPWMDSCNDSSVSSHNFSRNNRGYPSRKSFFNNRDRIENNNYPIITVQRKERVFSKTLLEIWTRLEEKGRKKYDRRKRETGTKRWIERFVDSGGNLEREKPGRGRAPFVNNGNGHIRN